MYHPRKSLNLGVCVRGYFGGFVQQLEREITDYLQSSEATVSNNFGHMIDSYSSRRMRQILIHARVRQVLGYSHKGLQRPTLLKKRLYLARCEIDKPWQCIEVCDLAYSNVTKNLGQMMVVSLILETYCFIERIAIFQS
ncbi:hypothetical protein H634G_11009 [Metarhizium anisopliae BRIP 53293]|uniref:Uncharacterized protein n=1 Tax=Metarhizium anisopliae BRIP 53293 TaxID=1291518 RepID=A0A0D9NIB4_METAN|nr:hypothetical protein H634G_11009 [Metarhizium anisopliae BRIP 53293]KJK85332.1 hypothetical protein H633G_10825 [Metarhizium anisopliae BRIP 53284]